MAGNLYDMYWDIVNAKFNAFEAGDYDAAFALATAQDNLGAPGERNSSGQTVTINFDTGVINGGRTTGFGTPNVTINLSPTAFQDYEKGADILAHEATVVGEKAEAGPFNGLGFDKLHTYAWYFDAEWEPNMAQSYFDQYSPVHPESHYDISGPSKWGTAWLWDSAWSKADIAAERSLGVWTMSHIDADVDCKEDPQCGK
jgi:hypothetical protein